MVNCIIYNNRQGLVQQPTCVYSKQDLSAPPVALKVRKSQAKPVHPLREFVATACIPSLEPQKNIHLQWPYCLRDRGTL